MVRRMFWFDMEDDKAVAKIMKQYRLKTKSAAVRLALKMVVNQENILHSVSINKTISNDRSVVYEEFLPTKKVGTAKKKRALKEGKMGMTGLMAIAEQTPLVNAPEDFSERFDHYRFAKLRTES